MYLLLSRQRKDEPHQNLYICDLKDTFLLPFLSPDEAQIPAWAAGGRPSPRTPTAGVQRQAWAVGGRPSSLTNLIGEGPHQVAAAVKGPTAAVSTTQMFLLQVR